MTWRTRIQCQKCLLSTFSKKVAPLRARKADKKLSEQNFSKFFSFLSWLGGKKLWKIHAPKKNVEKILTKYWQNVDKMLKKSCLFIVRFQFEWMKFLPFWADSAAKTSKNLRPEKKLLKKFWKILDKMLTKCWKNIAKIRYLIVRFQFEWMNVSKSVGNS